METNLRIGTRVYCWNFEHWGTVTNVSADTVDTIVDYIADDGSHHQVYAYMLASNTEE